MLFQMKITDFMIFFVKENERYKKGDCDGLAREDGLKAVLTRSNSERDMLSYTHTPADKSN